MRLTVLGGCGGWTAAGLACTGDSGPSPLLAELAHGAGVFLAEATNPWQLAGSEARYLSTRPAGRGGGPRGRGRAPRPGHRTRSPVRMSR
jgi:hypothetical protein